MTATRAELRTAIREDADQESTTVIVDTTINRWIDEGRQELHEILTAADQDYAVLSTPLVLTPGNPAIALPTDFLKEKAVDLISSGQSLTLKRFQWSERNRYSDFLGLSPYDAPYRYTIWGDMLRVVPIPTIADTLTLWYVPQLAALTADNGVGGVLPPTQEPWKRYIIMYCVIRCRLKEEEDVGGQMAELMRLESKVRAAATNRNAGEPGSIVDVRNARNRWGRR